MMYHQKLAGVQWKRVAVFFGEMCLIGRSERRVGNEQRGRVVKCHELGDVKKLHKQEDGQVIF